MLIQSFVTGQSQKNFLKDIKGQNATLYQFLIIGEAIRHIDPSILKKYPYPWHIPKAFRNYIAHEYHHIKIESVYHAACNLDDMLNAVDDILKNEF